jgi:MFS family permease
MASPGILFLKAMDGDPMKRGGSFYFGWIIVSGCFITLALVYSLQYSFSVFFVTLIKEFGWSRSTGAGAFSLFNLFSTLTGPLIGSLILTLGLQRVILLGALLLGAGLLLCSFIETWWQFYLYFGIIVGLGVGAAGWVPNVTLIQLWFREKRGLATGIISSGVGIGILSVVPATQHLILRVGWRTTYRLTALMIPLVVISIAMILLKRPPSAKPGLPGERGVPKTPSRDLLIVDEAWTSRSWSLRQAAGTKRFWLLGLAFFLGNFLTQSIFAHQVAFFVDHALSAVLASYLVGFVGVVSIGGKILWGALSDRVGREMTYTLGMICLTLGIFLLIFFDFFPSHGLTYAYSVCFGIGYAVTAALPPLITADLFEGQDFGSIFGALMVFNGIGAATGAWFTGLIYDWAGSYIPAFILLAAFSGVACLSIWSAGPRKIRRVPGKLQGA